MNATNYQYQVRRIGHQMQQLANKKLEVYHITHEQGHVLDYLVTHLEKNITQKKLEQVFNRKGSSISSIVTNLEKKGFVERKTDLNDERRKIIRPLPKGLEVVQNFKQFFEQLEKDMAKDFSEDEKELLTALLNRIGRNLGEKN